MSIPNFKDSPGRGPLLSTADVARWLGVAARTVCLWAECGEIPALKIGRQWRFREDELHHWLEDTQGRVHALVRTASAH